MERTAEIRLALLVLISVFIHIIGGVGLVLPDYKALAIRERARERLFGGGRDIIVNVNEDDRKAYNRSTLLSDRDSAAKGYLSRERGDHWLNNSLDFSVKRGKPKLGKTANQSSVNRKQTSILVTDNTEVIITMMRGDFGTTLGQEGHSGFTTIPDRNSFSRKNAIYYSNDGRFSFNTMKFKNFRYFKAMKDKIASHWYPPLLANAILRGYDPITGTYTPGRVRIMAIPNQEVKLYFTMNRKGDVLDVVLVDSHGNRPLDLSCLDAVRLSRSFGAVPHDIKGEVIIIPFVFLYIVN